MRDIFPPFVFWKGGYSSRSGSRSVSVDRRLLRLEPLFPSCMLSANAVDEAEDTVEAGEDFLDELGRIIVSVAEDVVFVEMLAPTRSKRECLKYNSIRPRV